MKTFLKKKLALPSLIVFSLVMSGCGKLDFTQGLLTPLTPITMSTAQGVEVVSGSAVGKKTIYNQYTVDSTVGALQDKLESSTPNGYKVFHGVKGSLISPN